MEKLTILTILVAVVVMITMVQTVQLTLLSQKAASTTGLAIASGSANSVSGAIDTSQMTENEKMNYEMHGTIPARFGGGSASNGLPQMVGGC